MEYILIQIKTYYLLKISGLTIFLRSGNQFSACLFVLQVRIRDLPGLDESSNPSREQ